ncbi:hypothetical protein [Solimonas marina]|uniref:Uncharacterized protein n=1 Tax=Solimonas marina TaxID=2714601 RepID=A0A969WDV5_9GAMM|nr:hypothetical protein [Solimonas marina]NKF24265.1 hypothetical protein [Solimonas marina]
MRYFTSEWWRSGGERDVAVAYRSYLSSVTNQLPEAALALDREHTLHDAEVKRIQSDFSKGTVSLQLLGWNQAFNEKIRYSLHFSGVTAFEQAFPQEEYVESELGDLGYWEWEVVPTGTELRMLFASSAEFRIVFRALAFSHVPA